MQNNLINVFLAVVLCSLFLTACGGESLRDQAFDCELGVGQSCYRSSPGGNVEINLKSAQEGEEYLLVYQSRIKFDDEGSRLHRMSITATQASAPISSEEENRKKKIHRTTHQNRYNTDENESASYDGIYFSKSEDQDLEEHEDPNDVYLVPHIETTNEDGTKNVSAPKDHHFISTPSGDGRAVGQSRHTPIYAQLKGYFQLRADESVFGNQNSATNGVSLPDLEACLKEYFPQTMHLLGTGFDLDGIPEVKILATAFEGRRASHTVGLFSPYDRFKRLGKEPLEQSNYGEIIYLSANRSAAKLCATASHEYHHLLRYDASVLQNLNEKDRDDFEKSLAIDELREHPGLDEGYAHVVEDLTFQVSEVGNNILKFLRQPNSTSLDIRTIGQDLVHEFRSRGLNTLIIYHALAVAGVSLNHEDPAFRSLFNKIIRSTSAGYKNLAEQVGLKEEELFESFYRDLALLLFNPSYAQYGLPVLQEKNGAYSSFQIFPVQEELSDRNAPRQKHRAIHALESEIPLLNRVEIERLSAEGVSLFRYLVPRRRQQDLHLSLSSEAGPYAVTLVRIR